MNHEKDCACLFCSIRHRIGFVSTRIAGTDGVSLETFKWAEVFKKLNFANFYFAGELDTPPEVSFLSEESHFLDPEIRHIYKNCFGNIGLFSTLTSRGVIRYEEWPPQSSTGIQRQGGG